ncbi:helix-turn-helix transcriptional regulator [Saccharothrix sp. NPDC042600]|uniref:helix-turn-helix domain-containing protein n=1 Tax=Saccharothrix TaxID=2071 RepID=UPI0033DBA6E6
MQAALTARDMGAVIRAFRTHPFHGRDIPQAIVASWGGISQTRLSHFENGEEINSLKKLMRWAHLLGIPNDLLWFQMPSAPPDPSVETSTVHLPEQAALPDEVVAPSQPGLALSVVINGQPVLVPLGGQAAAGAHGVVLDRLSQSGGTSGNPAATVAQWSEMSPLNRRSLLKHGLGLSSLSALGLPAAPQLAAAMDDAHRYLDSTVVEYFRRQLAACKADDGRLGSHGTMPAVLGLLGAIEQHAREVKPAVRRELLAVGADIAEFAGWLYRDLRDLPTALYWHDRAIEWAQEAGDMAMQGYVLVKKAQLAYDERDPMRMLTLSQAAQHPSYDLPKRVRAEAVQQEARAEAMLGAAIDSVERKLDEARNLLAAAESQPDDRSLGAHYGPSLLTMQAAICQTEAGQPRRAVALYERTLNERTFSPRDYGFFLSWMAASLALAGEPDQAAATGVASAHRAKDANSQRTKRELVRVLDVLKPWRNRPAVRQLQEAVHPR